MGLFNKAKINRVLSFIGMPLLVGIPLFYSILLGVHFRTPSISSLEGEFLHGSDSYRHMRHIEQIVENGSIPETDDMRHVPFGYKNNLQSEVFPWFIARGFKILNPFVPKLSLYQVAIFYPLAAIILVTVLFFCLTKHLFNFPVAFLATPAFVSMKGLIDRTLVGRVDTDAMVLFLFLLAVYLYVWTFSTTSNQRAIGKLAFSIVLGILSLIWPGVAIAAGLLYGCDFLVVLYKGIHWKSAVFSIVGVLCYLSCLLIPSGIYMTNLLNPFVLFAIVPAFFAMGGYIVGLLKYTKWGNQHRRQFSKGIGVAWGVIAVVSFLICLIAELLNDLLIRLLYPFGNDPIMTGINELQHFEIGDWWNSYGLVFFLGFLGFGLLIYESWSVAKKDLKYPNSHLVVLIVASIVMICCRAYTSFFLEQSLVISTLFLIMPAAWVVLHTAYIAMRSAKYSALIVVAWFVVAFNLTCSALRFILFFAPVLALTSSIVLVKALDFLTPSNRKSLCMYFLLTTSLVGGQLLMTGSDLLVPILQFSFLSGFDFQFSARDKIIVTLIPSLALVGVILHKYTELSSKTLHKNMRLCGSFAVLCLSWFGYTGVNGLGLGQQAFATGLTTEPHPSPAVREAVKWLKENTSPNSVIAADWDYGSAINQLGERATIIDEEHNRQTIRSFYRKVICSEDPEEALTFLKKHRVTHLMLTLRELSGLTDIYELAYPDRKVIFPLIIPLTMNMNTQDPHDYREFSPMEKLILPWGNSSNSLESSFRSIEISKIAVDYVKSDGYLDVLGPPQAYINLQPSQKSLGIQEIVHNNQQWYFPNADLSGTLWINDAVESYGAFSYLHVDIAAFFSDIARNFWIAKLFLDNSDDRFKLVFSTKNGYTKIWEVIE